MINRENEMWGVTRVENNGFLSHKGPEPARIQEMGYRGVSYSSRSAHHTRRVVNTRRKRKSHHADARGGWDTQKSRKARGDLVPETLRLSLDP